VILALLIFYAKKHAMNFQMRIYVDSEKNASSDSDKRRALIDQIRHASKSEQNAALNKLLQLAQESGGDEKAWSGLALGLFNAGRFEKALYIFRKLADTFPRNDLHRLNIATCHSQLAQFDLCRRQLKLIAADGSTPQTRQVASQQLIGLEEWLGQSSMDLKFNEMKIMALQERVDSGDAQEDDYVQVAGLLLRQESAGLPGAEGLTERGLQILEQGATKFPQSVPILEHLAGFYIRLPGFEQHYEKTLLQIEKLAPDSPVLEAMNTTDDEAREISKRIDERAHELMHRILANRGDADLINASLKELRRIVSMFGQVPEYRKTYAFALMTSGRHDEARQEAEILATMAGDLDDVHFHLGQIFWICGDQARGRHHLELAVQFATTEEDRKDAIQVLSDLEKSAENDA
jgi:tetratricopeptide (TPR) repeat protein